MELQDILFRQGFGTRRVCAGLIQQGRVEVAVGDEGRQLCREASAQFKPEGLRVWVQGQEWICCERAYLMLHKPAGTECSQKPSAWPSVYTLLPAPLRQRPGPGATPGVQAIGRLDQDTTGLLLFTDDGQLIHRLASPRHHVPKIYDVLLKHAAQPKEIERLLSGVVLNDDPEPVRAAACELLAPTQLRLTLTAGKYHQVKRMVAAVGNRVEALHRSGFGELRVSADLRPGQWRWLTSQEVGSLKA